jgi:endonuclease-3 related protein
MNKKLLSIYNRLYKSFGPQGWWPADSAFEVAIGAILTQNTSWQNVERAIDNLKKKGLLTFEKMYRVNKGELARLIRPAGYFNIKAKRIKNFLSFLKRSYNGSLKKMSSGDPAYLRQELLSVNGIGPETADSILLYALGKPVFVVDAYTKRIFSRHKLAKEDVDYHALQSLFMMHLPPDEQLFNEYHALLVKLAKDYCRKSKKECLRCPIHEKK